MAVLPGGNDVFFVCSNMLREQLNIGVLNGLKAKVAGPGIPGAGGQEELIRRPGGNVSIRHVSLTLNAVQRIVDFEAVAGK